MLIENSAFTFGKIGGCILCIIFMESFTQGRWRLIIFLGSLTGLISAILFKILLKQSPRFLFSIKETSRAIEVMDYIGYVNHGPKYVPLHDHQKQLLADWAKKTYDNVKQIDVKTTDLFKGQLLYTTAKIWIVYFAVCFNFFGLKQVSPYIFAQAHASISFILYQTLGQLPFMLVTIPLVDHPKMGRVRTLIFVMYVDCALNVIGAILVAYDHIITFEVLSFIITVFN